MRFFSVIIGFISSYVSLSQDIKGTIIDNTKTRVAFANVQLIETESNRIVSYTQTDGNGNFSLKLKTKTFPLKIKISHLSYQTRELVISSFPEEQLKITLEPRANKLKDVVVEHRVHDIVQRNDTLIYNLKNLLNGSELKLKDVIGKLPGLSVDSNGKIRYKGKIIDHLLIDDDEFFRENHQIPNENLTAQMIEKIELLGNYQDFSSIKGFENQGRIALNIGLKDEHKEKLKGNSELEGGYKNQYKSHNNLYSFGSKIKFNLIANVNNTNYSVISVFDYLNIRQTTGRSILSRGFPSGFSSMTEKDLPSFLSSRDNINTIELKNSTLNFTKKINEKERIEFISIFNHVKQTENKESVTVFFDDLSSNTKNTEDIDGASFFSSSIFKYENKIDENSYFNINSYLFVGNDKEKQKLSTFLTLNQNTLFFDNNSKLNTNKFGINTSQKIKLSDKILFEGALFNDYNFSQTTKKLNSDSSFYWFDHNENQITQKTKPNSISFGVQGRATLRTNLGKLSLQLQSLLDKEKINNSNTISGQYNFENFYTKTENTLRIFLSPKTFRRNLNYTIGVNLSNHNHALSSSFDKSINTILPDISFSYRLNNYINASVGYSSSAGGYSIVNFLSGNLIENHRAELISGSLIPKKLIKDTYNISLSYVNIPENIFSMLSLSHNNGRRDISKTYENNSISTKEYYNFIDEQKSTSLFYSFEKKFYDIPYGLKLNYINTLTERQTMINTKTSNNEIVQTSGNLEIKSYYKKGFFNFNFGIEYVNTTSKNTVVSEPSNKNKLETISPFLRCNGFIFDKKINWDVNSNYYIFNSRLLSYNKILDLGVKVIYSYNSKLEFYIHTNNMLNIKENNTKNSIMSSPNFTQETIMSTLSGYINFGIIWVF